MIVCLLHCCIVLASSSPLLAPPRVAVVYGSILVSLVVYIVHNRRADYESICSGCKSLQEDGHSTPLEELNTAFTRTETNVNERKSLVEVCVLSNCDK